jgi:hypothetical protein
MIPLPPRQTGWIPLAKSYADGQVRDTGRAGFEPAIGKMSGQDLLSSKPSGDADGNAVK